MNERNDIDRLRHTKKDPAATTRRASLRAFMATVLSPQAMIGPGKWVKVERAILGPESPEEGQAGQVDNSGGTELAWVKGSNVTSQSLVMVKRVEHAWMIGRGTPQEDGCAPIVAKVIVTGCGCRLPGAKVRLHAPGGGQAGEITTGGDGTALWTEADVPGLASGGYYITLEPPPLYKPHNIPNFGLNPCGMTLREISLEPVDGYACKCYPGIPMPITLEINGTPGSLDFWQGWGYRLEYDLDTPCLVPNGASTTPVYQQQGALDVLLGCKEVVSILTLCGYVQHVGWGGEGAYDRNTAWRWIFQWITSIEFDIDPLSPIDITFTPAELGLPAFPYYRFTNSGSNSWVYEADDPGLPESIRFVEVNPQPKPTVRPGTLTTGQLCVRAILVPCGGIKTPIQGASIEIKRGEIIQTGTADEDGKTCKTVLLGRQYEITVAVGTCEAKESVFLPELCEADSASEVEVVVCCARICIDVFSVKADPEPADPLPRLANPILTVPGEQFTETEIDGEGRICAKLTTKHMRQAGPSADCTKRVVIAIIDDADGMHMRMCVAIEVACQGEASATARLYSYYDSNGVGQYNTLPAALRQQCPEGDCGDEGWTGRGLVAIGMLMQFEYLEYEYATVDENTGIVTRNWHTMLPGGLIGAQSQIAYLDTQLLDGIELPEWHSPYGNAQRVEWQASGAGDWTTREGNVYTHSWSLFLNKTGAVLLLKAPHYDAENVSGYEAIVMPGNVPEGSPIGTAHAIRIEMPFVMDICDFVGDERSHHGYAEGPQDPPPPEGEPSNNRMRFRWRLRWTRAILT